MNPVIVNILKFNKKFFIFEKILFYLLFLLPNYSVSQVQTVNVVHSQKISDTEGNFTGTLDNTDLFGSGLANIGDLNGDGIADLAVGVNLDDDGGNNVGAIWILFLKQDGTVNSYQKISDTYGNFSSALTYNNRFGLSITSMGDLNGDGITDLAVGAEGDDDGGADKGAVFILFLDSNYNVGSYQKISSIQGGFTGTLINNDHFGYSVSCIGDLNGDGVNDLAVGTDNLLVGAGALWILFLNSDGTVNSYQKISDTDGNFTGAIDVGDHFGSAVASLGDLNGDSHPDIIVGASGDDDGGTSCGTVYILFLDTNGTVLSDQKISNLYGNFTGTLSPPAAFGWSVASVSDFNGDGVQDILVGAQMDDGGIGGSYMGAVWLIYLNTDGTVKYNQKITPYEGFPCNSSVEQIRFGFSVAFISNLNESGMIDIAVGAPLDDDGGSDRGAVAILFMDTSTVYSSCPVANFSADSVNLGDYTNFQNLSYNSDCYNVVSWQWDFGDGNFSTVQSPTHLYDSAGVYDVQLIVTNDFSPACSDTIIKQVVVESPGQDCPSVSFSINNTCSNDTTYFIDLSSDSLNNIISWQWDFGDGNSSSVQNPFNIYYSTGVYNVELIVTNNASSACSDTIVKQITINPLPFSDFSYSSPVCPALDVSFSDNSTVSSGNITSWYWNFYNAAYYSELNPTHFFNTSGDYFVTLTVTSDSGCSYDTTKTIHINYNPMPNFNTIESACANDIISFTDSSMNSPDGYITNWHWDFGNGDSSSVQNPQVSYSSGGIYNITFSVSENTGCAGSILRQILINPQPVADFNDTVTCFGEPVYFTNNSTIATGSISALEWNFGDSSSSTDLNPFHNYSSTGTYAVTLIALSDSGCSDTIVKTVNITDSYNVTIDSVNDFCFNDPALNLSASDNGGIWSGTGITDTIIGTFDPVVAGVGGHQVIYTTSGGCIASDTVIVTVNPVPSPVFIYTPACPHEEITFTDSSSVSAGGITTWSWDFGNGVSSTIANPVASFDTSGNYSVKLTVTSDSGCYDDTTITVHVYHVPAAEFTFSDSACNGNSEYFLNASLNSSDGIISSYNWNFGSGDTSILQNPQITYSAEGSYTVSLTVTENTGCKDTVTHTVSIYPTPTADFSSSVTCVGETTIFTDVSSITSGSITSWLWDFGDLTTNSTEQNPSHNYSSSGTLSTTLSVVSEYGCSDSVTKTIVVNSVPVVQITTAGPFCPENASINLTASESGGIWSGTGITNTSSGSFDPATAGEGTHQVIYTITNGCTNSDTITITVYPAPLFSLYPSAVSCIDANDGSVALETTVTGGYSYYWSTGDTTKNIDSLAYGMFYVTVTSEYNCQAIGSAEVLGSDTYCYDPLVFIPNIFSPNGDGINDILYVKGTGIANLYFAVYDRWGEKVFETTDIQNGWDATYNGIKMSSDVYVYYLNVTFINGENVVKNGNLTIIK